MLTTKQAASKLGINRSLVIRLCKQGRIVAQKIGRDWMIDESALASYKPNPPGRPAMNDLKRIEIQNQPTSDTYRALLVYRDGSEHFVQRDYGTIGEAARDMLSEHPNAPVYRGRKRITSDLAESGELG